MSGLGIVTALAAESRTLGQLNSTGASLATLVDGTRVAVSGMGPAAAAAGAVRLVEAGATALISWGVAGALAPVVTAGTLVLPREVLSPEGVRLLTAPEWRASLAAAVAAEHPVSDGSLLTCHKLLRSPREKSAAFQATRAVAVDMESFEVATIAARFGLPFIAVRAIVDTAEDSLPAWVAAAVAAGTVRARHVVGGLLRMPLELGALIRLWRRYQAARRVLIAVARSGALASVAMRSAGPSA